MPEWIGVRTPGMDRVITSRAPFDAPTTDALVRAARSIRRGPPAPAGAARFSVYVVLLELPTETHGLYVGMTGRSPDERFMNHKNGHKASRWVRRYGVGLLPALYRHLNPTGYEDASQAEIDLAEALRRTGIRVHQA